MASKMVPSVQTWDVCCSQLNISVTAIRRIQIEIPEDKTHSLTTKGGTSLAAAHGVPMSELKYALRAKGARG
jgi:hypothetical protein